MKLRDIFNDPNNKFEGYFKGVPIYSNPFVPDNMLYVVNDNWEMKPPSRKDGQPDMRYKISRLERMLKTMRLY